MHPSSINSLHLLRRAPPQKKQQTRNGHSIHLRYPPLQINTQLVFSTGDPDYLQSRCDDFGNSYFKIFPCNNKGVFLSVRQWSENIISPSIHPMNALHWKVRRIKWRFKIVFRTARIFSTFWLWRTSWLRYKTLTDVILNNVLNHSVSVSNTHTHTHTHTHTREAL
jgi:hypothetical protein